MQKSGAMSGVERAIEEREQASCVWTPDMVDSLVETYADTMAKAGKVADNGSLTSHESF